MADSGDFFQLVEDIRVRFPPFESSLRQAEKLPIANLKRVLIRSNEFSDVQEYAKKVRPVLKLGSDDSWLLERNYCLEKNSQTSDDILTYGSEFIEFKEHPELVDLQRKGWYLTPHSLHLLSRRIIPFSVVLLLFSIIVHVFEPVLISFDLFPKTLDSSVKLGLLDYPMLLVVVSPFVIAPLLMRIIGNIIDLGRQRIFLSQLRDDPVVKLDSNVISDQKLVGSIEGLNKIESIEGVTVWWQVGLLPPSREMMLECLGSNYQEQPPPGFSTPIPHYWKEGLSDGTDVGESTPLQSHDAPGGIFLAPLRIHSKGSKQNLEKDGGVFSLDPPNENWPGTQNGRLIRVHWELVLRISRTKKTPLYWVMPLGVKHGKGPFEVPDLPVQDGRLELTVE